MALKATVVHQDGRYPFAAAAAFEPGDVVVRADGSLAIYDGLNGCASGERIDPDPIKNKIVKFAAASAEAWAAGVSLYWDNTAKVITALATANTLAGTSVKAKTAGQTSALVNC